MNFGVCAQRPLNPDKKVLWGNQFPSSLSGAYFHFPDLIAPPYLGDISVLGDVFGLVPFPDLVPFSGLSNLYGSVGLDKFLNCAPTPYLITSRICRMVEENKSLTDRIQDLEEKKANLDKEHREAQDDLVYRRREMVALTKKGEKLREERDGLHNQNRRQHFEKNQLEKELKAATDALTLEEGIPKELQVAIEASRMIMERDKVALLEKEILVQFKGVPQHFAWLHTTIQDYSNKIIAVQEGLEAQMKAVLQYLHEKHKTARRSNRKEKKKVDGEEIVVIDGSNSEGGA